MSKKITALTALGAEPAAGDLFHVIDVSDTSQDPAGSSKKVRYDEISPSASETVAGRIELATNAETLTGTATDRAITPANLTAKMDTDGTLAGNSDTRIPTQKAVKAYADTKTTAAAALAAALAAVYPVGSIYINASVSTNPATLFGFGTWVAYAAGRVVVGLDSGQTEFDTLNETGGAKTHTLDISEIPAHTHSLPFQAGDQDGSGSNGTIDGSSNSGSAGGGAAHNNLQPYIVAYMWKRTA